MKKSFILLCLMSIFSMSSKAQNVENDLIFSENGFVMMTSSVSGKYYSYDTTCLYSADGKTMVAVMYYDDPAYMSVLPGTEKIAPNALRACASSDSNYRICIPTSVKYVYPTSFITSKGNVGQMAIVIVTDEVQESATSVKSIHEENGQAADVSARYNIQGLMVDEPVQGVNIIRMSDNTVQKVLVK